MHLIEKRLTDLTLNDKTEWFSGRQKNIIVFSNKLPLLKENKNK